jgi:hypothetical protein
MERSIDIGFTTGKHEVGVELGTKHRNQSRPPLSHVSVAAEMLSL